MQQRVNIRCKLNGRPHIHIKPYCTQIELYLPPPWDEFRKNPTLGTLRLGSLNSIRDFNPKFTNNLGFII